MDQKRLKINKILEYVWLAIALASAVFMAHSYYNSGYSRNTIILSVMIFVSFFMFRVKRKFRLTVEKATKVADKETRKETPKETTDVN